ncbi:MAG: MBL fold metallo-hydrolase, partial [Parasporobacterium sp.]|nr:MBL fold metallo-hydrolase [Parasporobacterium sp.]
KRLIAGLNEADLSLSDIDGLLITHEHMDHISSLGVLLRAKEMPVYATEGTVRAIKAMKGLGDYNQSLFNIIRPGESFSIGDLDILPMAISHDAYEPVCYRVSHGNKACGIVTDLGEYNDYLIENIRGCQALMIEANHDRRMLQVGPYPYHLKTRIAGRFGHLSNEDSGRFISELLHDGVGYIALGHISAENNMPELARMAVEQEIDTAVCPYKGKDFNIHTASRNMTSELYEF